MSILYFIPDNLLAYIIHGVFIVGLIGSILGFFLQIVPAIAQYRIPFKIIFGALFIAGVYFEGSYTTESSWRTKVAEVEAKLKIAEEKSQEVNVVIQEKTVETIKEVKKNVLVNHTIIQKQREVINADCKIPDIAITLYNNAVDGKR